MGGFARQARRRHPPWPVLFCHGVAYPGLPAAPCPPAGWGPQNPGGAKNSWAAFTTHAPPPELAIQRRNRRRSRHQHAVFMAVFSNLVRFDGCESPAQRLRQPSLPEVAEEPGGLGDRETAQSSRSKLPPASPWHDGQALLIIPPNSQRTLHATWHPSSTAKTPEYLAAEKKSARESLVEEPLAEVHPSRRPTEARPFHLDEAPSRRFVAACRFWLRVLFVARSIPAIVFRTQGHGAPPSRSGTGAVQFAEVQEPRCPISWCANPSDFGQKRPPPYGSTGRSSGGPIITKPIHAAFSRFVCR